MFVRLGMFLTLSVIGYGTYVETRHRGAADSSGDLHIRGGRSASGGQRTSEGTPNGGSLSLVRSGGLFKEDILVRPQVVDLLGITKSEGSRLRRLIEILMHELGSFEAKNQIIIDIDTPEGLRIQIEPNPKAEIIRNDFIAQTNEILGIERAYLYRHESFESLRKEFGNFGKTAKTITVAHYNNYFFFRENISDHEGSPRVFRSKKVPPKFSHLLDFDQSRSKEPGLKNLRKRVR